MKLLIKKISADFYPMNMKRKKKNFYILGRSRKVLGGFDSFPKAMDKAFRCGSKDRKKKGLRIDIRL